MFRDYYHRLLRDAIEALQSPASNPIELAYEALLLATALLIPPETIREIWTAGGRVYMADTEGSRRQLPLLMPAAQPNVSPDQRRIVFVRDRRVSGEELSDEDRMHGLKESLVGDVWIAGIDGSQPELVLKGGPCPHLIQTEAVAHFPRDLRGISNPQFDPESRLVYFIADAWTTSGAIYLLDSANGRVSYFTDGNVFVVLQGEPYRAHLLVAKHRYYESPNLGSYDHFWLVTPSGETLRDAGDDLDTALCALYGPDGRKVAFPDLGRS